MTLCNLAYIQNLKLIRAEKMTFARGMGLVLSGKTLAKGYKVSLARSTDSVSTEREVYMT